MEADTKKAKKNHVRLISMTLAILLLLALMLFHRQINNFFTPTKKPVYTQLQPATPKTTPQVQTPVSNIKPVPSKPNPNNSLLNKQGFTIQLMGASNFNELTNFVATNSLRGQSYILHSIKKGQDWYSLIYGIYPTHEAAETARAKLPASLKQSKPWIRSMDSVHNTILQDKQPS